MTKKRLIIVDVSNFIFRAFFAIRPMHAPNGTPTNAVYGMFTMLLKLLSDHRPSHVFLARDTKGGSFRNSLYEGYKANRSEPPEDLIPQFALIDQLIQKMNLPTFSHENYEADDIIGSAVVQWKKEFEEIYIASGDKDLMQFVGDNVYLLDTMKDKLYSPKDVFEKMGVEPIQIVDFLSIVGDTSDNIPGMKGIGAVGAANLLKEYRTFENIVANKENLKGKKTIEAFTNHLDAGILSKKLVQIVTDIELGHSSDETAIHFYPGVELEEFLKGLGFKSILTKIQELRFQHHMAVESDKKLEVKKLDNEESPQSSLFNFSTDSKVTIIDLIADNFDENLTKINSFNSFACYSIYNGEDIYNRSIVEIFISCGDEFVFRAKNEMAQELFEFIIQKSENQIFLENVKREYVHSLIKKVEFKASFFDVPMAHFNINAGTRHDVDTIAVEFLGLTFSLDEVTANAEKAKAIFDLTHLFKNKLKELEVEKIYYEIDMPLIPVLSKMEKEGIALNPNFLLELENELEVELRKIEEKIYAIAGDPINLNSPKQVGALLFEKLNLPVIRKTKTGYSTDAEVLEELVGMNISEVPGLMLTHREFGKILSTYVKALPNLINPATKRIHTNYNVTVAQTGRLSSTNPNLQNIPIRSEMGQRVRKAFIAKPGLVLLSADYSQVELRLLAHFSKDPTMLKSFKDNLDIHAQTASEVLDIPLKDVKSNDRSMAKNVNFGLMYGQGSFGLAATLKISRTEAKNYIDKYFSRFNAIKDFLDKLKDQAEQTGYAITYHGRKRLLPDIYSQNRTIKAQAERMAINSPIQGTAADIIKLSMISIDKRMQDKNLKSKMLLQVHDELIFEVYEEELTEMKSIVRQEMENVVQLDVPLTVSMGFGINWFDLK